MKLLLLTIGLAGLAPAPARAQKAYSEEVLRSAVSSPVGYQKRTKDDRYEGLYSLEVGAPLLDVVSVTLGEINYELANDRKLIIKAPKTPSYKLIGVSGLSFGLSKNYRLDALITPDGQRLIPIKDVLSPGNISPQHLGVYGYVGEPRYPSLYVPVRVSDRPAGPDAAHEVRILLLPGAVIDKLNWQYARSQQGQCADFTKGDPPVSEAAAGAPRFPAQKPIALLLAPGAATGLHPGDEVCINVSYRVVGDTDWRTKTLKVLMPN